MIRHITNAYVIVSLITAVALFSIAALPLYPVKASMIPIDSYLNTGNPLSNSNNPSSNAFWVLKPQTNTTNNSNALQPQNANTSSNVGLYPNPLKGGGTLCDFLVMLLNIITEIGAIIGALVLIGVGFFYILARGNKDKLQTAHRAFLMSILGITLLLGASVLAHILITTVNAVLSAGGGAFANQSALTCTS